MGDRLAWLARSNGYRISTGFVGTPLLCDALSGTGHIRQAGRMLRQTECPSWLYPVTMGATTIWERWDSLLEDGSINPGEMTSFNHYALGAIADWMHRVLAGLAPAEPGYRRLLIAPQPISGLDWAATRHETPYGLASAEWRRVDGQIEVRAVVPPNTSAHVILPGGRQFDVSAGTHSWQVADECPAAPLTVTTQTPLSEVIDDETAYHTVIAAFAAIDPALARDFLRRTVWAEKQNLSDSFSLIAPRVAAAVQAGLDQHDADQRGLDQRIAVHGGAEGDLINVRDDNE